MIGGIIHVCSTYSTEQVAVQSLMSIVKDLLKSLTLGNSNTNACLSTSHY